jgi:hypothetical protein
VPRPVRAAQILMYVVATLTVVLSVTTFLVLGSSAETFGQLAWFALPGIASLALAVLMPKGGAWLWRAIIALEIVYVVLSLARLASGDPRGVVNLVVPIAILVLITRPAARSYFHAPG